MLEDIDGIFGESEKPTAKFQPKMRTKQAKAAVKPQKNLVSDTVTVGHSTVDAPPATENINCQEELTANLTASAVDSLAVAPTPGSTQDVDEPISAASGQAAIDGIQEDANQVKVTDDFLLDYIGVTEQPTAKFKPKLQSKLSRAAPVPCKNQVLDAAGISTSDESSAQRINRQEEGGRMLEEITGDFLNLNDAADQLVRKFQPRLQAKPEKSTPKSQEATDEPSSSKSYSTSTNDEQGAIMLLNLNSVCDAGIASPNAATEKSSAQSTKQQKVVVHDEISIDQNSSDDAAGPCTVETPLVSASGSHEKESRIHPSSKDTGKLLDLNSVAEYGGEDRAQITEHEHDEPFMDAKLSYEECLPASNIDLILDDPSSLHADERNNGEQELTGKRKQRRSSRKSGNEADKSNRKRKKVSDELDVASEEPTKKKLPHRIRQRRRQVDKTLLEMPEDEIDRRQISIRNLILYAESKEKIAGTAGASTSTWTESGLEEAIQRNSQQNAKRLNYHSYMEFRSARWSKAETEMLYQGIRRFGTDFEMIQQLMFPNRTRHQVKLKYKNEERKHPMQIHDALKHRSKDLSHLKEIMKQLNIEMGKSPAATDEQQKVLNNEEPNADGGDDGFNWYDDDAPAPAPDDGFNGYDDDAPTPAPDDDGGFNWYDDTQSPAPGDNDGDCQVQNSAGADKLDDEFDWYG